MMYFIPYKNKPDKMTFHCLYKSLLLIVLGWGQETTYNIYMLRCIYRYLIIVIIIVMWSSYIALFLTEDGSKLFTYYAWQTCYIHHLLNFLGSIHLLTYFKVPRVIQVQLPS